MIYLDNAATSFYRPETVARAVAEAINTMGNCSRGTYETALTSARTVYETRDLLSGLFHGDGPEQVAFTANSTESLNIAIKGVLAPGDRVVTTALEHNSVLRPLYEMERQGVDLVVVGCTGEMDPNGGNEKERHKGALDYNALKCAPMLPTLPAIWWISGGLGAGAGRQAPCSWWTRPRQRACFPLIWNGII